MKVTSIIALMGAVCYGVAEEGKKGLKLGFNIHRGDTVVDAAHGEKPKLIKRAQDDGSVSVKISNGQTFYLAELEIGSKSNKVQVLIDTGSSDLWVMSHDVDCTTPKQQQRRGEQAQGDDILDIGVREEATKTVNKDIGGDFGDFASLLSALEGGGATDDPFVGPGGGGGFFTDAGGDGDGGSGSGGSGSGGGSNTCTSYGSFNTENSDSFRRNDSAPVFSIAYADGSSASGIWGYDDVNIGGNQVSDLSFAVANKSSSDIGVLGIGLTGLEVTYSSGTSGSKAYQYLNLPFKMKADGLIEKAAYSVFLGEEDDKSGTILFGAVDHSKYKGELISVPIVNSLASFNYDEPIRIKINLDQIKIDGGDDKSTLTSNGYTALLDTGSTLSYFPTDVLENLGKILDLKYDDQVGAFGLDCNVDSSTSLEFIFGGTNFSVPISQFVLQTGDSSGSSSSGSGSCYLGILPQSSDSDTGSPYFLLGDNFIRNFYAVYDLDDLSVSLAVADFDGGEEDIEVISSSVPGASSASDIQTKAYTGGKEATATGGNPLGTGSSDDGDSGSGSDRSSLGSKVLPSILIIFVSFTVLCM